MGMTRRCAVTALVTGVVCSALAATFTHPLERVASVDPIRSQATNDSFIIHLLYETILKIDYFVRPYKLSPGVCELPEVSADGLTYSLTVREGIAFHPHEVFGGKGRALTAEDVAYTLRRLADPKNASGGMWTMACLSRVDVLDARRLKITLKQPQHVFPWLLAMPFTGVVAREAVEKYGPRFGGVSVGSGPYRLAAWRRNHQMSLARMPDWHGWQEIKTVPFDRMEFPVVDDPSTKWLMFLAGQADFLRGIATDNWDAIVGPDGKLLPELYAKGVRLHSTPMLETTFIGCNMKDPVLGKSRKLRQALNCAFDFEAWNKFSNGRLMPCTAPVPPGIEGRVETPFKYAYNPEKAKRLLKEAGYPDGIDPATGRHLVLPIILGNASQQMRVQMELIVEFYDRVGLRLEPRYLTWNAFLQAVNEGRTALYFLGWVADYPDAENFMQLFHSKNVSPGANHANYVNPAFDALYDRAMATLDKEERMACWREAQEIVREDCPLIWLDCPKRYWLSWKHVGNFIPSDFMNGAENICLRTEAE